MIRPNLLRIISAHKAEDQARSGHKWPRFFTQHHRRTTVIGLGATVGLLLLTACGSSTAGHSATSGEVVTVAAAASLTEAFTAIGKDFEAKNPSSKVIFSFGSSATLASQITQGAPVDVFAAASLATMKTVAESGAADPPSEFVANTLEIAVPKGNPGKIAGLKDFANKSKKIAICASQVPCGAAAIKVFGAAKVMPAPDTLEQDVKATLQKVESNEVDAALVYRTDVMAAGDTVQGIDFPEAQQAINVYPIATLKAAKNHALAQRFVDYVLSPDGQAILNEAGFDKP
jgi:molybdate transport system substrate-binding protein